MFYVAVALATAVPVLLGLLVVRRGPPVVGWLLVAHGVSFGVLLGGSRTASDGTTALVLDQVLAGSWIFLFLWLVLVAYLVPDGRPLTRRWRNWMLLGLAGAAAFLAGAAGEAIFGPGVAGRVLTHVAAGSAPSASPFPSLTEREREVLDLVARGTGNATIAHELGISLKTVRNHVSNIFAKLQVSDRSSAIVTARDAGMGGVSPLRTGPGGRSAGLTAVGRVRTVEIGHARVGCQT